MYNKITFVFLLFSTFVFSQSTMLKVNPPSQTVHPDSLVSVQISIEEIEDLHAFTFTLNYNPEMFRFESYRTLDFLSGYQTFVYNKVDSNKGTIKYDEAILGPDSETGTGELVEFLFTPLELGEGQIYFSDCSFRDSDNNEINIDTAGGTILIDIANDVMNSQTEHTDNNLSVYPNPFNNSTTLNFKVNKAVSANIVLYNSIGQRSLNIYDGQLTTGNYNFRIDAANLSSGLYICVITLNQKILTRKILLLK